MLSKEEIIGMVLRANEETIKRISDVLEGNFDGDDGLTTREFAKELGVSISTAYKMIYAKEVIRICYRNRVYRIPRSEVLRIKKGLPLA